MLDSTPVWRGARCARGVIAAVFLLLVIDGCGRSVRGNDAADEGAAGDGVSDGGAGTSGSSTGGSSTGGKAGDGAGGSGGTSAGTGQGGGSAGAGAAGEGGRELECVVARTVECCPKWLPATRTDVETNDCIVAEGDQPTAAEFERCTG